MAHSTKMVTMDVVKHSAYALVAVDDDGTPLHLGERMVEIAPGQWVTPLVAMALAMFEAADGNRPTEGHRHYQ